MSKMSNEQKYEDCRALINLLIYI